MGSHLANRGSPKFENEAKNKVSFDYHPERHGSHRINYSGQANTELIYDYRQEKSELPVQKLNQSDNDSYITEDSCKERYLVSGDSTEDCV